MPLLAFRIAEITGIPVDQIRIVLSQIYSLILSFILFRIRHIIVRKYFSLVFGTLLQLYVYRDYLEQYLLLILQIGLIYMICYKFRRQCGALVTVLSVLLVSFAHIYRLVTAYGKWELEISTLIMMTICKFSLFAYQYQDGMHDNLTENQRKSALTKLPSFYDYICYIQFLPTSVMGPSMDYLEYSTFINLKNQYKSIPSPIIPVVKSFIESLSCLLIYYFIYLPYFPIDFMSTGRYLRLDGVAMIIYSFISVSLIKTKYYFAWKLNGCSIHACGISYSETTLNYQVKKQHQFTKHSNVNILKVQTSSQVRDKIANWNISVQTWLRRSIYERIKNSGQLITFMVSAFWHGFYGGYYIAFFLWFVLLYFSKLVYKINRNYPIVEKVYSKTGFVGEALAWLYINILFCHIGSYFILLRLETAYNIMKAYKFVPVLLIIVPTLILHFSGLWKKNKTKQDLE